MLDPSLCARWDFLRTLHPLFPCAESLPTVEGVDQGQYHCGVKPVDDADHLKNEITILRNDFKLNIIKQRQVDIDELFKEDSISEGLQLDLQQLLQMLENLVKPRIHDIKAPLLERADEAALSCFPKLVAMRNLIQHSPDTEWDVNIKDKSMIQSDPSNSTWAQTELATLEIGSSSDPRGTSYQQALAIQAASYIQFPHEADEIKSCRRVVSRFGIALDMLIGDTIWATEAQTPDYTPQDLKEIEHAHNFASTCKSLFDQIVDSFKCEVQHQAKLHLSGFKKDRLRVDISSCLELGSVPASFTFTLPLDKPLSQPLNLSSICSQLLTPSTSSKSLYLKADTETDFSTSFHGDPCVSLEDLLTRRQLKLKHRMLVGVLLAASLFKLSNSPWIKLPLNSDTLFVPQTDKSPLHQWCPRIVCSLVPVDDSTLQSESIAAFGVLILELAIDQNASWDESDTDWISGEKSNLVRLARILKAWEDDVSDEYRSVAKACLEFDSLIETTSHSDIMSDMKSLAIIYKFILQPLFHHTIKSFGNLAVLFKDMFGCGSSLASMSISLSNTAKRILFDDEETTCKSDDMNSAKEFVEGLKPFTDKILSLRKDGPGLMKPLGHDKIRIAILDSGVDDTDPVVRHAKRTGRFKAYESKSFVGQPSEWQDTHGHGTHVTRLLLTTAPAAVIFVGKICKEKTINDEFMPGIAKAIDWAVEECDAHIISMSFGFEDENDLIDAALDKAVSAGKLIFAAASNNGGISGRTRPARRDDVICIHASDGKGNKGGMNPTQVVNGDNFTTLGVAVPSKWKGKETWKTGTSFATPIAAGFAADVLEFANHKCTLTARKKKLLQQKRGMQAIFRKMAEKRDGYDFVHPVRLWKDGHLHEEASKTIEDIMRGL